MLATIGNEDDFESFRGLQKIGPKIFEYKLTPSYEIKRLQITEKGKIVGTIVFTTKDTPTKAESIQLCKLLTNRKIKVVIKRHIK